MKAVMLAIAFVLALSLPKASAQCAPAVPPAACNTQACAACIQWNSVAPAAVNIYAGPLGAPCNPGPAFTLVASGITAINWMDPTVTPVGASFKRCYYAVAVISGRTSPNSKTVEVTWAAASPSAPSLTGVITIGR